MSDTISFSGRCLCGAISYRGRGPVVRAVNCHCSDCQQATGGAFASIMMVRRDDVEIDGTPLTFAHRADSGSHMTKHFCGTCGSPMFNENSSREGVIGIRAGSLEDASLFRPTANIFCDSAMPATAMAEDLPRKAGM